MTCLSETIRSATTADSNIREKRELVLISEDVQNREASKKPMGEAAFTRDGGLKERRVEER